MRLRATLNPPPGPSLPGDYDFARAAWFLGLGAVGSADGAAEIDANVRPPPLGLRLAAIIARVRQAIGERILAALPGEAGAIANALITGERGGISEATNQAFRDFGLFHILSISGLHMVIMAGAVFLCIRLALAAIPAIALRYPIKKWAAAGAMLGALGYLLISGAAFATVRSYIMISIMFLAVLLDRPAIALRNVALAALAILRRSGRRACSMPASRCRSRPWWRWCRPTRACGCAMPTAADRRGAAGSAQRSCSSAASSRPRWWRASPWRHSASTISTTRKRSPCWPTCWRSRSATSS